MKVRDLIKQVEKAGWQLERIRGSHRHFRHPERPEAGTLTIAGHTSDDVRKGCVANR